MFDFTVMHSEKASGGKSSVCAISLADYQNGICLRRKTWIIKPPGRFSKAYWHEYGVTEQDAEKSPAFHEVWKDIRPWLNNKLIIAFCANDQVSNLIGAYNYYYKKVYAPIIAEYKKKVAEYKKKVKESQKNKDPNMEKLIKDMERLIKENPPRINVVFEFLCLFLMLREAYAYPANKLIAYREELVPETAPAKDNYFALMTDTCARLINKLAKDLNCENFLELKRKLNITFGECFNWNVVFPGKELDEKKVLKKLAKDLNFKNFPELKHKLNITFGERVNWEAVFLGKGWDKEIDLKRDYFPCLLRSESDIDKQDDLNSYKMPWRENCGDEDKSIGQVCF